MLHDDDKSRDNNRTRLLQQQFEQCFTRKDGDPSPFSPSVMKEFLEKVSETYTHYEEELKLAKSNIDLLRQELEIVKKIMKSAFDRYEFSLKVSKDGYWEWDCTSNLFYFSSRWKKMLGYEETAPFDKLENWIDLIHDKHKQKVEGELKDYAENKANHFEVEYQIRHQNGCYSWMLAHGTALYDSTGKVIRIAGSQTDISLQKQHEEQSVRAALHDRLTELPNRFLFSNRLGEFLDRMALEKKEGIFGAVIILDLDRFKVVNDSLGHYIGDNLLVSITQRLKKVLRPRDTLSRLGGDEFAILLEDISSIIDIEDVADRVAKKLENPFYIENEKIVTSASIGIALLSDTTLTTSTILRNANLAMYDAKSMGRRRYNIYNMEAQFKKARQFQLEKDLSTAIQNNDLFLLYQPVVSLDNFSIHSFESLIRWNHKSFGILSPNEFIPLAEESGLIIPLGKFALEESCRQLSKWKNEAKYDNKQTKVKIRDLFKNVGLNINISINQLSDSKTVDALLEAINTYNLPPFSLNFEITESALAQNMSDCLEQIEKIRSKNINICIDDFGTGFSSLNYLHTFPFDYIKIDTSFIKKIMVDDKSYRLVAAIINLAHDLNQKVVAEGVEYPEEVILLRQLNCDYAQGHYFSRPVPPQDAADLLIQGFQHIQSEGYDSLATHPRIVAKQL